MPKSAQKNAEERLTPHTWRWTGHFNAQLCKSLTGIGQRRWQLEQSSPDKRESHGSGSGELERHAPSNRARVVNELAGV